MSRKRIGILTGGGDCPGLNAVIRAAVRTARENNFDVLGIQLGFEGLLTNAVVPLTTESIRGILPKGGTLLRTTNRGNPFEYPDGAGGCVDRSAEVIRALAELRIDGLIAIGGDGTLRIAQNLCDMGIPIVAVPKTIDNDLAATDYTFGFHTAVAVATEAVDRLHSTAESHNRVMILEVMGRNCGWIALFSGIAGGADIILIPEIPYSPDHVARSIRERQREGSRFDIIVVAEGAKRLLPMLKSGKVVRGYLGMGIRDVDDQAKEAFSLPNAQGALVQTVEPGKPADQAGIKPGDVVVEVDGHAIRNNRELIDYISYLPVGTSVKIAVIRDGQRRNLTAKTAERPLEGDQEESTPPAESEPTRNKLGMAVQNLTPALRSTYSIDDNVKGVVVTSVKDVSPAGDILSEGDVISEVQGQAIANVDQFRAAIDKLRSGQTARIYVVSPGRGRQSQAISGYRFLKVP